MHRRAIVLACVFVCSAAAHALTLEQTHVDATQVAAGAADPFRVKARLGGLPSTDLSQSAVTLRLGDLVAEIPAGRLRRRKGSFAWKGAVSGVKRVTLRVRKSTLDVAGGGVELGDMPAPVRLEVGLGGEQACGLVTWTGERTVRAARKRGTRHLFDGVPAGCDSGPPPGFDPVPPTVQITSPVVDDGIAVVAPAITIGGVAFDDRQLVGLAWANDRGGGASFLPSSTWSIPDLSLAPGDNTVTVSATDAGGNVVTDTLVVTYNTNGIVFEGMAAVDPDALFVTEGVEVMVRQAIAANDDLDPETVRLVRITDNGGKVGLGKLSDDGDLAHGDEIQSDGIYTGKIELGGLRTGLQRYRISARTFSAPADMAWSPTLVLPIIEHLSEDQLDAAIALANDARAMLENLRTQGTGTADALAQVVALAGQRGALAAGQSEGGLGAWWVDASGLLGGVLAYDQGTLRAGAPPATPAAARVPSTPPVPAPLTARPVHAADGVNTQVGSRRVAVIAPDFATEEPDDVAALFGAPQCPPYDVDFWSGSEAGAERFMNLDGYGFVLVASHGDTMFQALGPVYRAEWRWESVLSQAVVLTGTILSGDNLLAWERDLRLGRIAVFPGGTAAVLPSFVSRYNVRFPQSVVFAGSCGSTATSTLANAFLGRGAATVYGFDGYVQSSFASARGLDLFTKLLAGMTTGEAFTPGLTDGGSPPVAFTMDGRADVSRNTGDILNTGFETDAGLAASVPGWKVEGDGRVLGSLGGTRPTEGSRLGLISTGLGFTTDSGSISQSVCLPPLPPGRTRMTLSWDWNFFSEEFREYCFSIYQDSFTVTFGSEVLQSTKIDDLCDPEGLVEEADVRFDKGDVWASGWHRTTADVTALAGTSGVLAFAAHDVGDSIFDSAILIDRLVLAVE